MSYEYKNPIHNSVYPIEEPVNNRSWEESNRMTDTHSPM